MWINIVLLTAIGISVITDLKSRRIYNKVVFPALGLAFVLHFVTEGWLGLTVSLLGFAVGLGLLLIPFLLGGMGAGDVKLLALVGALKGTMFVLIASVYMAFIGGLLAILILLFKAGLRERIRFAWYAITCLLSGIRPDTAGQKRSTTYPYGVAIAGGAAVCLWLKGWGVG